MPNAEKIADAMIENIPVSLLKTTADGWCSKCGCGNDKLGYSHLPNCRRIESSMIEVEE